VSYCTLRYIRIRCGYCTYNVSYCNVGSVRFDANANRAPRGRHVGCRRSAFGQVRLLCGHDSGRNFLLLGFQDAGGVGARVGVEAGCHWRLRLRPNWITRQLPPLPLSPNAKGRMLHFDGIPSDHGRKMRFTRSQTCNSSFRFNCWFSNHLTCGSWTSNGISPYPPPAGVIDTYVEVV
jgi:hypothetical protein